jgi:hypothetical protein
MIDLSTGGGEGQLQRADSMATEASGGCRMSLFHYNGLTTGKAIIEGSQVKPAEEEDEEAATPAGEAAANAAAADAAASSSSASCGVSGGLSHTEAVLAASLGRRAGGGRAPRLVSFIVHIISSHN